MNSYRLIWKTFISYICLCVFSVISFPAFIYFSYFVPLIYDSPDIHPLTSDLFTVLCQCLCILAFHQTNLCMYVSHVVVLFHIYRIYMRYFISNSDYRWEKMDKMKIIPLKLYTIKTFLWLLLFLFCCLRFFSLHFFPIYIIAGLLICFDFSVSISIYHFSIRKLSVSKCVCVRAQ